VPAAKRPRNYCFGCGRDNSTGLHLKIGLDPENAVARGTFRTNGRFRGSRLHLHGGIIATLLDEAMGNLNRLDAIIAPTAELSIQYLRPVPIGKKVVLEARRTLQEGRNYWREGTVSDEQGNVLARATARFVKIGDRSPNHP
jgi:uncharacterized protein (TIGR00369 family)